MRTVFEYLYRDASNYKASCVLLLEGPVSQSQVEEIRRCLEGGEYFIPGQVNMPSLQENLFRYSDGPTDDDHVWHEFVSVRPPTEDECCRLKVWGSVEKLVSAFRNVADWNVAMFADELFSKPSCGALG